MRLLIGIVAVAAMVSAGSASAQTPNIQDQPRPTWLKKPSSEDLEAAYPMAAMRSGAGGRAVIVCEINERGLPENCSVKSEDPQGLGFGHAALLLAPRFIMKPAMKNGKPVRSSMPISVAFEAPGRGFGSVGSGRQVVTSAIWDKAPTWAELVAANPTRSGSKPVAGNVTMPCRIDAQGLLEGCTTVNVVPKGRGFESAALKLAKLFQIVNDASYRKQTERKYVNIAVNFPDPAQADVQRVIVRPEWKAVVDQTTMQSVFPAKAEEAGLRVGRSTVECKVAPDGALQQCKVLSEDPPALGFGDSALLIARSMTMNLWTFHGEPTDGAQVRLPIVVRLPEQETPAKSP